MGLKEILCESIQKKGNYSLDKANMLEVQILWNLVLAVSFDVSKLVELALKWRQCFEQNEELFQIFLSVFRFLRKLLFSC